MGTDPKVIEVEIKRLQFGNFNSMEELYEYKDEGQRGIILDGYKLDSYKYVNATREIPDDFKIRMGVLLSEKYNIDGFEPFDGTMENFRKYQEGKFRTERSWSQLVYQNLLDGQNFATQDPDKIIDLKLEGNLGYKEAILLTG